MADVHALRALPIVRGPLRLARSAATTLVSIVSRSRLLVRLYYLAGSNAFDREQYAVLSGRAQFYRLLETDAGARALLRRNIHRIEKGLTAPQRRARFAADYIGETVQAFARAMTLRCAAGADGGEVDEELGWAHAVLQQYFESIDRGDPRIDAAGQAYDALALARESRPLVPYTRSAAPSHGITFDAFLSLARQRRSVRQFEPRPVPRELIDTALTAATQSPSACNRQPFVFRVFDDPAAIATIASFTMGARDFGARAPMLIVVIGQLRKFFDERDRHVIYIDGSLAAMSFMLALETLGLSSCPINWPDIPGNERRLAGFLHLADDERPIMLMAVGYPAADVKVAYSQKKPPAELRRFN